MLRSSSSGVPTRLLSSVAAAAGPEELARLAAAQGPGGGGGGGWVIRLVDVAPGANVEHYLRAWEGGCGWGRARVVVGTWGKGSTGAALG